MKTFATLTRQTAAHRSPGRSPVRTHSGPARAGRATEVQHILHGPRLQPKLAVGPPNDACERQADRVADAVMRMPEGRVQRACAACEEEMQRMPAGSVEDTEAVRARELPGRLPAMDTGLEARIQALRGGGRPLGESERTFFEPRFGADFGGVRLHAGGEAAELARAVSARAFTVGGHVVFGAGEYAPASAASRRLLAHELTHVVQQNASGPAAGGGVLQRQALPAEEHPADTGPPAAAPPAPAPAAPAATCHVAPIAPITDADAAAMEGGTRVIWNNTSAGLQAAANDLVTRITGAGGTATITSAYRPQAYQDHLREVWDKARALRDNPGGAECDTVRAAVNAEMANHSLNVDRPVAQISNHRAGNAVDISWTLPATRTHALCGLPVPEGATPPAPTEEQCIDSLAAQAGLTHRLHAADRPHFEI